jgi:hypothetical protein
MRAMIAQVLGLALAGAGDIVWLVTVVPQIRPKTERFKKTNKNKQLYFSRQLWLVVGKGGRKRRPRVPERIGA